jgi:excisionase family DNA binding protein
MPETAVEEASVLLTVKEAAERLSVSPTLVYALCSKGLIRHERHGLGRGVIRISEEALEEYRLGREMRSDGGEEKPSRVRNVKLKHIRLS